MTSYYSVIQFVPNPSANERINLGVVVHDEASRVRIRFVDDWRRVRNFAGHDVAPLRDFAVRLTEAANRDAQLFLLPGTLAINQAEIEFMAEHWMNSIQVTKPRPSTRDVDALLDEVGTLFLQVRPTAPRARDRRVAARLAAEAVTGALQAHLGLHAPSLVRRSVKIKGKLDQHDFDIGIANGELLVAAQGISFEVPEASELRRDVDATAWTIDDVRSVRPDLPIAVIALPPPEPSAIFERAERIFTGLSAEFVPESQISNWAEGVARRAEE